MLLVVVNRCCISVIFTLFDFALITNTNTNAHTNTHKKQKQTKTKNVYYCKEALGMIPTTGTFLSFKEPPLLGPGAAFPPFGAPDFHPTTPENWKGAAIHPPSLMKDPPVVGGRNPPVAFAPQSQGQVS